MQSHRTAVVASPQAREPQMGRGGRPQGASTRGPRREWRRRGRRRTPPLGAALAREAGIGAATMGGARRRRDAAGRRAGRAETPPPAAEGWRARGRGAAGESAGDGHGATNSPPDRAQTAEGRARRRWNAGGEPLRERTLDAGPRERALPLPNGSARDRRDRPGGVPKAAARPIFEQKPFLLRIVGKVIFPTVSKRSAFAQARLRSYEGGTVYAGEGYIPFRRCRSASRFVWDVYPHQ